MFFWNSLAFLAYLFIFARWRQTYFSVGLRVGVGAALPLRPGEPTRLRYQLRNWPVSQSCRRVDACLREIGDAGRWWRANGDKLTAWCEVCDGDTAQASIILGLRLCLCKLHVCVFSKARLSGRGMQTQMEQEWCFLATYCLWASP